MHNVEVLFSQFTYIPIEHLGYVGSSEAAIVTFGVGVHKALGDRFSLHIRLFIRLGSLVVE